MANNKQTHGIPGRGRSLAQRMRDRAADLDAEVGAQASGGSTQLQHQRNGMQSKPVPKPKRRPDYMDY